MRVKKEDLKKVLNMLIDVKVNCLSCGRILGIKDIRWYYHGDGYLWVYYHCSHCGYDNALQKYYRLRNILHIEG